MCLHACLLRELLSGVYVCWLNDLQKQKVLVELEMFVVFADLGKEFVCLRVTGTERDCVHAFIFLSEWILQVCYFVKFFVVYV